MNDLDFTILGKDNKIEDKRIRNNLLDAEFYDEIASHVGLYYHSKEERHLHYHPLEAIIIGTPIIFHDKSLLATAYLENSPGKCSSYEEVNVLLMKK